MDNVINFADKKREKEERKRRSQMSVTAKIKQALKKWGSHSASKRKNDENGMKKD